MSKMGEMSEEKTSTGPAEGTAVYSQLRERHGAGFKTQWVAVCRMFGFDPATTASIYATAVSVETSIEGRTPRRTLPDAPPRPLEAELTTKPRSKKHE